MDYMIKKAPERFPVLPLIILLLILVVIILYSCKTVKPVTTVETDSTEVVEKEIVSAPELVQGLGIGDSVIVSHGNLQLKVTRISEKKALIETKSKVPVKTIVRNVPVKVKTVDKSKSVDKSKEKIRIKDKSKIDSGNKTKTKTVKRGGIPWWFWLLIIAAAAGVGIKVYRKLFSPL